MDIVKLMLGVVLIVVMTALTVPDQTARAMPAAAEPAQSAELAQPVPSTKSRLPREQERQP